MKGLVGYGYSRKRSLTWVPQTWYNPQGCVRLCCGLSVFDDLADVVEFNLAELAFAGGGVVEDSVHDHSEELSGTLEGAGRPAGA